MANYHFVYKDVEGASTQWDDIQRKLGNLPPKPPAFKPPSFKPAKDKDSKHKDKARHCECDHHRRLRLSVDAVLLSQQVRKRFINQVMTTGQRVTFEYHGNGYIHR